MKTIWAKSFTLNFCLLYIIFYAYAQPIQKGGTYSMKKLSQEPVRILAQPKPLRSREVGDTTLTIYRGGSVDVKTYFVHGDQYDNIFNPSPTGIYINRKHFLFFCGIEMSIRKNYDNMLQFYEFSYLGKRYLMLINYREDCLDKNKDCRYRCYNIFDITKLTKISQLSFSSIFEGTDTFGDFNSDGILDFVKVTLKRPKSSTEDEIILDYLVTAYTLPKLGEPRQLRNQQNQPYYLNIKGDKEIKSFNILRANWFFNVKDNAGKTLENEDYFGTSHIAFDPYYKHLYTPDGVRMGKNKWSVYIAELSDLESAKEQCRRIQKENIEDVFIMVDQYGGEIKFRIFVGNFINKDSASERMNMLTSIGILGRSSRVFDFKNDY